MFVSFFVVLLTLLVEEVSVVSFDPSFYLIYSFVLTIELTFLTVIGQWMNIQFNVLYLIRKLINTGGMMDVTVTINYSLNRRLTIASQVRLLSHYIFSVRDLLLIDSWTNHVLMS